MSHQVLARKWRPRTFQTLIGQDHVVRALDHALTNGRLHHAYLFTGTRGVGKTTIARILAKAVNCERGMSATPCGECSACREIDEGRFVDYLELDAASNRKVEEMTQLLDNAVYAPTVGRYKVYVIDEVHMLSTYAFNAMLKTLEEPPPHVLFILATTDPQKVPVTVLSRCMQFNLRNLRPPEIAAHLETVLRAEAIEFEAAALTLLGRVANGSMRDALSLLDQAIAFGGGVVREEPVAEMLGTVDSNYVERIFRALTERDAAALIAVADDVTNRNAAADSLLAELAQTVMQMALKAAGGFPDPAAGVHADLPDFSPEELQVYYQILIYGRRDLPLAPDLRAGLTMTLLRLAAFTPVDESSVTQDDEAGTPSSGERPPAAVRGAIGARAATTARAVPYQPVPAASDAAANAAKPGIIATGASRAVASVDLLAVPAGGEAGLSPVAAARAMLAARRSSAVPATSPEQALRPPSGSSTDRAPRSQGTLTSQHRPVLAMPERHAAPEPLASDRPASYDAGPGDLDPPPVFETGTPEPDSTSRRPASTGDATSSFDGDWPALAARLPLSGRPGQFLRQSQLLEHGKDSFALRVPIAALAEPAVVDRVRSVLSEYFGRAIKISASAGVIDGPTVVQRDDAERAARLAQAEQIIADDPFIQTLLDEFDAQILPGSIRAIDSTQNQGDNHA